jgi:hypothetical protein
MPVPGTMAFPHTGQTALTSSTATKDVVTTGALEGRVGKGAMTESARTKAGINI